MVMKGQGGYEITLDYRTDLYRAETARGLQRMFVQVLGLTNMPAELASSAACRPLFTVQNRLLFSPVYLPSA